MPFDDVSQRTDYQTLSLVGQQLSYLATGATGNDSANGLEQTITEKKFSNLDARLQYLIEDLALLQSADFIEDDQWTGIWDQLSKMHRRNRVFQSPRGIKNINEDDYPYYNFGVQIGHLARLLCQNGAPEFKQPEISSGFLIGLAGEFMTEPDLSREVPDDKTDQDDVPDLDTAGVLSGPSSETLRILDDVQNSLVNSQETTTASVEDLAAAQALKKLGLMPCAPLRDELWQRANENEYLSSDKLLESIASKIQSDHRIGLVEELAEYIAADLELLADKRDGKIEKPVFAYEVFHAVCSQVNPTSSAIRDKVREYRRDKPAEQTIFKLRNDLQGEGTDSRHWEDHSLIEEDSGNYKLTPYGRLVGIIATPDATDRTSNEYLPQLDEEEDRFCVPTEEELLIACYACAFGQPSETRQRIFEAAYEERISE